MLIKTSLDLRNGFLPAADPLKQLPPAFKVWEEVATNLRKLLVSDSLRKTLEQLPVFPVQELKTEAEFERAMLLLSFLGHAYVWGPKNVVTKLPQALAQPWYEVAKILGRPPVLSYASYAEHNWYRLDPKRPIELGNIALLQNFHGGVDEEWFVLVHVYIEAKAAPALQAMLPAQQAVMNDDADQLINCLYVMATTLEKICDTLDRMPEHCDPYIYYHRVRPYIHAWKGNEALPDGLIYEGVQAYANQPQKFRGETGAQSTIIPSFDAVLGISHEQDQLRIYLQEMRDYMPIAHRLFLADLESYPSVRDYVINHYQQFPKLREYYNQCVELVTRFRHTHLTYAATYIHKQHQNSLSNPTETGTGGTPFMIYLKKHQEESKQFLID